MGIFGRNTLMDQIKAAFSKVKSDINKLASWTEYFNKKHQLTDDKLDYLASQVSEERIKRIVREALSVPRLQPAERKTISKRIIKTIKRQSKDYIRHSILSLIQKYGKITALQLRDIVVEEQGLCSKSTFYRILEEIENSDEISVIKKAKEKQYLAKILTRK